MYEREVLRMFAGVAGAPSFTKAAAALGVARPRLSRAMLELEEAAREPLFDRDAGPGALTPAGERLLATATAVLATPEPEAPVRATAQSLRVRFVPGVTLGRWGDRWNERFPGVPLDAAMVDDDVAAESLQSRAADVVFLRDAPGDGAPEGVLAVPVYEETVVAVAPRGHFVEAAEEIVLADLDGETVLTEAVPGFAGLSTAQFVELVAAGSGIVLLPQPVARLHARRDVVARPVTDAPVSRIRVAWREDDDRPEVEAFVGVVRGRTANTSRGAAPQPAPPPKRPRRR